MKATNSISRSLGLESSSDESDTDVKSNNEKVSNSVWHQITNQSNIVTSEKLSALYDFSDQSDEEKKSVAGPKTSSLSLNWSDVTGEAIPSTMVRKAPRVYENVSDEETTVKADEEESTLFKLIRKAGEKKRKMVGIDPNAAYEEQRGFGDNDDFLEDAEVIDDPDEDVMSNDSVEYYRGCTDERTEIQKIRRVSHGHIEI